MSVRTAGWRRVLREPLVHFAVLAAALFAFAALRSRAGSGGGTIDVVVAAAEVKALRDDFRRAWRRQPTAAEVDRLIDEWVRDELLAREAVALGLDRDDAVVRQRLQQQFELAAESRWRAVEPLPGELEAFFRAHAERYGGGAPTRLEQVLDDVRLDWEVTRAAAAREAAYRELRAGYEVVVQWPERAAPAGEGDAQ